VVTRIAACLIATALASGCVIQANSSRNATLPFHPDGDALASGAIDADQPFAPAPPRAVAADLRVEELVGYYPDLYGLEYSSDGAFRKILTAWTMPGDGSAPRPEQLLTAATRTLLTGSGGRPVLLSGAVVELAMYKLGEDIHAGAAVELRVVVDGHETYTARYRVRARTRRSDLGAFETLWPAMEGSLLQQIGQDSGLVAAIERGGRS
jgi:hypothetical protein